jgi:GntR family transcriptional repressor for pyruvate dehydrogenase complex
MSANSVAPAEIASRADGLFEPVKGSRLSVLIADQLHKAIVSGALAAGTRLPPERELAARFEASRTSVQHAVHMLELMGLVTIKRGSTGGAFVTKPDFVKVSRMLQSMFQANQFNAAEIIQARLLIEPGIAEIAARKATEDDVAALRDAIDSVRKPISRGGPYPHTGRNFHYLLACATGSELLIMLLTSLLGIEQAARAVRSRPRPAQHRVSWHERIVDAIERRDANAARRLTAEHLEEMLEGVTEESATRRGRQAGR